MNSEPNRTGADSDTHFMALPGEPPKIALRIMLEVELRDSDVDDAITLFDHLSACAESFEDWDAHVVGGRVGVRPEMEASP